MNFEFDDEKDINVNAYSWCRIVPTKNVINKYDQDVDKGETNVIQLIPCQHIFLYTNSNVAYFQNRVAEGLNVCPYCKSVIKTKI